MRLTIIAPESVYEHEVDPSMNVEDVRALIEAETGTPADSLVLSSDSGVPLTDPKKSLSSYGLRAETETLFLTLRNSQPVASSSSGPSRSSNTLGGRGDAELETMRLQALGNPSLMAQLRNNDPDMAAAMNSLGTFKQALQRQQRQQREAAMEKERQIEALNADPYDIEAQKKIEEAIRMEAVLEQYQHAMEYSPEQFGSIQMLYINVEVNGFKCAAFVDSGAQTTIISPECAEACGLLRLLDKRFAGVAVGVGSGVIAGRIHSAQIKVGNQHLPVSFSVLEGTSVQLLFGLDMLKRHQACIDLSTNTLRINGEEIPFLAEHEIAKETRRETGKIGDEVEAVEAGLGPLGSKAKEAETGVRGPETHGLKEEDIQTLVGLGAPREYAIQLLEAAGGNVDAAASYLF
ncbi:DNA damage-inducible protein 1, partial [Tremellales sp. Uapishka_1]